MIRVLRNRLSFFLGKLQNFEADYLALVHVNNSFSHTAFLAAIFASISLSTTRSAARMAISSSDMQSASWQASVERK